MFRPKGILLCAIILAAAGAHAIEIGVVAEASNLFFPWTDTGATPPSVTAFPATNYFWGGEAWLSAPIGIDGTVKVSYVRDPVLRNLVTGAVEFERGIAKISVGPLVGMFNSTAIPFSAGLTTSVELRWPGVAYVSVHSQGGLAIGVLQLSQDPQAQTDLAAGFYVPNAIVSGLLSVKRFNDELGGSLVTDTATRYALTVDIFKKNVPYTALMTVGYELRSKFFAVSDSTDSLGSVILGAKVSAQVARGYTLSADLESAFYTFGIDNLMNRGPNDSAFMFSAGFGLVIDLEALRSPPAPPPASATSAAAPATSAAPPATPAAAPTVPAPSPAAAPAPESQDDEQPATPPAASAP